VQKFASGGVSTSTSKCAGVTVAGGNGYGLGATQLTEPYGVALDAEGNVFVADTWNHRVQKFASGCVSTSTSKCAGVTVAGGNLAGSAANQLERPFGVALGTAADGSVIVYVADTFNNRVQRWAPGATAGVTVASGDGYGSTANWPFDPRGLAVDSNLNLYVVDDDNNRVQKWSP
jgi:sugar lactone lactonase YvrE